MRGSRKWTGGPSEIFRGRVTRGPDPPEIFRVGVGASMRFVFYDFFSACFRSPNYNNISYTRKLSIKILQSWSNWSIDYIKFYVLLENISLNDIWPCHHCRWRAVKLDLCSILRTFEQGGGSKSSLSCHTCFDTLAGHRSHPQHDVIPLS
jgi:hypothetical protein